MTRRQLLALVAGAPAAAWLVTRRAQGQGLGQFTTGPASCADDRKPTPAVKDESQFKAGSPERASLIQPGLEGKRLVVTGAVIGLKCGAIKGATVDVWQADAKGLYDAAGFRLRGHQLTDAEGRYRLETIVPGATGGRARRLNVHVQPPGKPILATQLFFSDDPASAKDPAAKPELILKIQENKDGVTASFNFILDL